MSTLINRIKATYALAPRWLFISCAIGDACIIAALVYYFILR